MKVKVSHISVIKEVTEVDIEDIEKVDDKITELIKEKYGEDFVDCFPFKIKENSIEYKPSTKTWIKFENKEEVS